MCRYNIYNENIISHSKCGTKYLDELFNVHLEKGRKKNIKSPSELLNVNLNIKYVIIRNPKEHFLSAIDTLTNNEFYLESIYNINDNHVYNSMDILYNDLDQHWCPNYCKYVYMLSNNTFIVSTGFTNIFLLLIGLLFSFVIDYKFYTFKTISS
jgi:hypothetical protein